jgi:hypothetical protein
MTREDGEEIFAREQRNRRRLDGEYLLHPIAATDRASLADECADVAVGGQLDISLAAQLSANAYAAGKDEADMLRRIALAKDRLLGCEVDNGALAADDRPIGC